MGPDDRALDITGLSADGVTAIGLSTSTGFRGYTFSVSTGRVDFADRNTLPYAISADGTTVVGIDQRLASGGPQYWRAFRQNVGDDPHVIGPELPCYARAVSGDGGVVTIQQQVFQEQSVRSIAMRWTLATGPVPLDPLGAFIDTTCGGISRDGAIVVGSASDGVRPFRGYRWTARCGIELLDLAEQRVESSADAISPDGRVIAGAMYDPSGRGFATVWRDGVPAEIGPSAGITATVVTPSASVYFSGWLESTIAMRWSAATGMTPLNDYLQSRGVTIPDGWTIKECVGVSDSEDVFALAAIRPDGVSQPVIAVIPSAACYAPFAIAGFTLTRRRRHRPVARDPIPCAP
ncbi:MAG: hypothetical protein JSR77_03585 [Planctomycetes bacterium]|nr:hypothetical protein [Planctomycetota bacterium]